MWYGDEEEEGEALFKGTALALYPQGYVEYQVRDLPVTVYAVAGTEGWGDSGRWQARPLVINPKPWGDPNKKYDVAIAVPTNGKVTATGHGSYKAGTEVTVKATSTEKGAVFRGWYDAGGNRVSASASYTFEMPATDVELSASFILPEEDYLWMDREADWLEFYPGDSVEQTVGWCGSETEISLKATGLPAGLKLSVEEEQIVVRGQLAWTAKSASGWVTIEASNKTGYKQSMFVPFTVGYDVEPPEVDEWMCLAECQEMECDAKSVSGLPAGLKYDAKTGLGF